jgi:thiamine biosynthesis protein ThiC
MIHYKTEQPYDVIDICKAYDLNFNLGNVVKYACRAGKKDDELMDLLKAVDYLEREIKFIRDNKTT